jgi:PAS domain-containing protein
MLKMFQLTREEALKLSISDLTGPASPTDIRTDILEEVLAGNDKFLVWQARRPHDGTLFQIEKFLTRINFGQNMYILCNIRDVSKAEEKQKRHRLVQFALDHTTESVICCDIQGIIIAVNQTAFTLFQVGPEIVGKGIIELDPYMSPQIWDDILQTTQGGQEITLAPAHTENEGTMGRGGYRCSRFDLNDSSFICLYLKN